MGIEGERGDGLRDGGWGVSGEGLEGWGKGCGAGKSKEVRE
jgi:hypothetical protein